MQTVDTCIHIYNSGNIQVVKHLLKAHANPNKTDRAGWTPKDLAEESGIHTYTYQFKPRNQVFIHIHINSSRGIRYSYIYISIQAEESGIHTYTHQFKPNITGHAGWTQMDHDAARPFVHAYIRACSHTHSMLVLP